MEGLPNRSLKVFNLCNQIVVLGAGPGYPNNINLLKGIISNQPGGHLARKYDDWDRVRIGCGNAADRIGGPRTGCDQANPYLTRSPGIAIRRMNSSLLVAHQDMLEISLDQFMIYVDDGRPGIAENGAHPFIFQDFQKYFSSCSFNNNTPLISGQKSEVRGLKNRTTVFSKPIDEQTHGKLFQIHCRFLNIWDQTTAFHDALHEWRQGHGFYDLAGFFISNFP